MADQRHPRWVGQFFWLAICLLCVKNGTAYTFNPSRRVSALRPIQNINNIIRDSSCVLGSTSFRITSLNSELSSDSESKPVVVPFLNIANILTISRVLAIPFLMLAFVMRKVSWICRLLMITFHLSLSWNAWVCHVKNLQLKYVGNLKLTSSPLFVMCFSSEISWSIYLRNLMPDRFPGRILGEKI